MICWSVRMSVYLHNITKENVVWSYNKNQSCESISEKLFDNISCKCKCTTVCRHSMKSALCSNNRLWIWCVTLELFCPGLDFFERKKTTKTGDYQIKALFLMMRYESLLYSSNWVNASNIQTHTARTTIIIYYIKWINKCKSAFEWLEYLRVASKRDIFTVQRTDMWCDSDANNYKCIYNPPIETHTPAPILLFISKLITILTFPNHAFSCACLSFTYHIKYRQVQTKAPHVTQTHTHKIGILKMELCYYLLSFWI